MLSNNFNYDLLHDFMRKYWQKKHYLLSITHVLFLKIRGAVIFEQFAKLSSITENLKILKNKKCAVHVITEITIMIEQIIFSWKSYNYVE